MLYEAWQICKSRLNKEQLNRGFVLFCFVDKCEIFLIVLLVKARKEGGKEGGKGRMERRCPTLQIGLN